MTVKTKTCTENNTEYCFCCGKELKKYHIVSFGTSATEFEMCKPCLKKLGNKITKVLDDK